jgi:signal transduction histidine kinase
MDKPQGKVVVSCVEESGCWKFGVADNGPGIDEKYHGKIFEIFQTLSTKDQSETTGVGLSIVKKVVELYGGKVWVQSRRGRGTTFYFTLPKQSTPFVEQDKFCVLVNDGPRTS